MNNFLYRLQNWVRTATHLKHNCNVYYKNERIFSCKNNEEAEEHIRRMYNTMSPQLYAEDSEHIKNSLQVSDSNCWKKFRNSFKVGTDN